MGTLDEYMAYLRENPERYWFKRKLYGWGWTPATWEGWLVIFFFIGLVVWNFFRIDSLERPVADTARVFIPQTLLFVLVLLYICWKTGEPPKWMWGLPKKKKRDEHTLPY